MENILEQYKMEAFDPKQPFLQAIYHLSKTYGNDYTLGEKVRALVQRFEEVERERIQKDMDIQLQKILKDGKN